MLDALARQDGEITYLTALRVQGRYLTGLSRPKGGEGVEIAARVQMITTATMTLNRDGVDQEEVVPHPFVIVGVMLPNLHQTISTDMCLGKAMGAVQAGEAKGGTAADVRAKEENVAAEVTVVEEVETGQNGAKTGREWSTGDRGKRKRSWTLRWTTTGVLLILQVAVPRNRQAKTAREMLRLPQPQSQMTLR